MKEVEDLVHKYCTDNLPIIAKRKVAPQPPTSTEHAKTTKKIGFSQFHNSNVLAPPLLAPGSTGHNTVQNAYKGKDFKTRLFITSAQGPKSSKDVSGSETIPASRNNVWVRTHHSDCIAVIPNSSEDDDDSANECPFHLVKEYFHAAYTNEDHMVAKATLTKLMTLLYEYERDEYFAFTAVLASGLSNNAATTSFHIDDEHGRCKGLVEDLKYIDGARDKLVVLTDILFRMMTVKRFLIEDDFCNIFRLTHCKYAGYLFWLQLHIDVSYDW